MEINTQSKAIEFAKQKELERKLKGLVCTNQNHEGICFPTKEGLDINGRTWK